VEEPGVVSLRYRLQAADTVEFQNPPPIERETGAFKLRLEDGVATAWLKEHHSSPDSARMVVEKYLSLWELYAALQYGGSPDVSFKYESAQVREPPRPPAGAPQVIPLSAATASVSAMGPRYIQPKHPTPIRRTISPCQTTLRFCGLGTRATFKGASHSCPWPTSV
jgi:hypothetical protein